MIVRRDVRAGEINLQDLAQRYFKPLAPPRRRVYAYWQFKNGKVGPLEPPTYRVRLGDGVIPGTEVFRVLLDRIAAGWPKPGALRCWDRSLGGWVYYDK